MQLESPASFATAIRTIEAELGIRYPESAPQLFSDLSAIIETARHHATMLAKGGLWNWLRRRVKRAPIFEHACLLVSSSDVASLKFEGGVGRLMDGYLLPFLKDGEGQFPNIYGYDLADPSRNRIVVYSIHTFVNGWPSPDAFLNWTKKYL